MREYILFKWPIIVVAQFSILTHIPWLYLEVTDTVRPSSTSHSGKKKRNVIHKTRITALKIVTRILSSLCLRCPRFPQFVSFLFIYSRDDLGDHKEVAQLESRIGMTHSKSFVGWLNSWDTPTADLYTKRYLGSWIIIFEVWKYLRPDPLSNLDHFQQLDVRGFFFFFPTYYCLFMGKNYRREEEPQQRSRRIPPCTLHMHILSFCLHEWEAKELPYNTLPSSESSVPFTYRNSV